MVVLVNPKNQNALTATKVQAAADTLGQKIEFVNAENSGEKTLSQPWRKRDPMRSC